MLRFNHLSLRRGQRILYSDVDLTLHSGWKVGISGANGTGKSSLFSLILGELHADAGDFNRPAQWTISHLAQETPAVTTSAIDYVLDGDAELRQIESELTKAGARNDGKHLGELHARFEVIDGYGARSRAARLLDGLGFAADQHDAPANSFSGGWRRRLNLAQALMCRSDLLLLDEPTNHLDLDAVFWLEDWLRNYPGTLLLISHDREFLDRIVDHIAHIERQQICFYTGNYSAFEKIRAQQLAQQASAFHRQQQEIVHIKRFVDRFRAKATKARQAQSRLKALQRMTLIAPAHVDSPFQFGFRPLEKLPNPIMRLQDASAGYGDRIVLSGASLTLSPGSRVGLLGHNGAGKSTLLKLLAGELPLIEGKREHSADLKIGYFAQHQVEQLHGDDNPLQHLRRLDKDAAEKDLRDHLGHFGFREDMALDKVGPLSGGEKARLVLAMLVYQRPALLLLDEPTNHLDIEMRHALVMALQDYPGAMVIISHDRHLLRTATDTLLLVADTHVRTFDGDLDNYRASLSGSGERKKPLIEHSANARKERRRQAAQQRQQLQPLKKKVRRLEDTIEKLQAEKERILDALAEAGIYDADNKDRLTHLVKQQGRIDQALAEKERHWLETSEALEAAEQS
jgi:ATP-binding cassette subfamily F protein 3